MKSNPIHCIMLKGTKVTLVPIDNFFMISLLMNFPVVSSVKRFIARGTINRSKFKMVINMLRKFIPLSTGPWAKETA